MRNIIAPALLFIVFGTSLNAQQILKQISATTPDHWSAPHYYGQVNGKLIFTAKDGIHGTEYWVTDGTEANTQLLKDINAGPEDVSSYFGGGGGFGWGNFLNFAWKDQFYFLSSKGKRNVALWKTDGTAEGTKRIVDLGAGETTISFGVTKSSKQDRMPTIYNDKIIFAIKDSLQYAIWSTDGTAQGTQKIIDLSLLSTYNAITILPAITKYKNKLVFWVQLSSTRAAIFSSDGTQAGTKPIFEMDAVGQIYFTEYKGRLFFTGTDPEHGSELWETDGRPGGTKQVIDLWPGPRSATPREMNVVNNRMIFIATDSVYGIEPFVTDGTAKGTHLLKDTYPGVQRSIPAMPGWDMSAFDDRAFFVANDSIHGQEMWVTDGTEKGTYMLKDIAAGKRGSILLGEYVVAKLKDHFYFVATDWSNGYVNIWKTACVPDDVTNVLPKSPPFGGDGRLYVYKDKLFFEGNPGTGYSDPAFITDSTQLQFVNTINLDLQLFPNPSTDYTLAAISNFTPSLAQLTIHNDVGQLIRTETIDLYCNCRTKTIQLPNLSRGTYMVTVSSKNEKLSKKLVVQ